MNKLLVGLVIISLILSVIAVTKGGETIVREIREVVGAAAGTTHTNREFFTSGLFGSGFVDPDNSIPVISDNNGNPSSTRVLTAAEVCNNNVLNVEFAEATGTIILPGPTSTIANGNCLAKLGDMKWLVLRNSTSSGNFIIQGGASSSLTTHNLQGSTSTVASLAYGTSTVIASSSAALRGFMHASSTSDKWFTWQLDIYK